MWCNSIALFVLPNPQTLGMLIDVDGIERLVNNVSKLQIIQVNKV